MSNYLGQSLSPAQEAAKHVIENLWDQYWPSDSDPDSAEIWEELMEIVVGRPHAHRRVRPQPRRHLKSVA